MKIESGQPCGEKGLRCFMDQMLDYLIAQSPTTDGTILDTKKVL